MTRNVASRNSKWVAKADAKEEPAVEEEEVPEVTYDTKSEGAYYSRDALLRAIEFFKKGLDKGAAVLEVMKTLKVEPRPVEEGDVKVAGSRRAAAELKKAKRSESMDEDLPRAERTESMMSTTLSETTSRMDPMLLQYVQSMQIAQHMAMQWAATGYTTVMLRNIPNRYTRDMLVQRLNEGYEKQYDFVYLPIDFNSKCNVGYAFINFRTPAAAQKFMMEFNNANCAKVLPGFSSQKIVEVCYARVQGKDQNMENLRDEKFIEKLGEHTAWQPLFLDDDHKEVPFSKCLGEKSDKTSRRRSSAGATPTAMAPPSAGFGMMPPWASYGVWPGMAPPVPRTTLATVLPKASPTTMVMLKGVPSSLTRAALIEVLVAKFKGQFDFLYLPGDSKIEGQNRGHCFINFKKDKSAQAFTEAFHDKPLAECFGVEDPDNRKCDVQAARLDGMDLSISKAQSQKGGKVDRSAFLPVLVGKDGEPKTFPSLTGSGTAAATPSAPSAGKGKGGGKGKDKGANAMAAAAARGYVWPGMYGQGDATQLQAYYRQMQAYQQYAHAQAASAAAAYAGHGGMLDQLGGAMAGRTAGRPGKALNNDGKAGVRKQFEFYFSADNLCKDLYLRSNMDADGWVSLELIASFKKIREFKTTVDSILEALKTCSILEVDTTSRRVRLQDEEQRKKWCEAGTELRQAGSPKAAK